MIEKAIIFATKAHSGIRRKGSDVPYIVHPLETGIIASHFTSDEEVISAAILHDTIEDTNVTYEDIVENFNKRVADLVNNESEDKMLYMDKSDSWKIRKQATINHMKECKDVNMKIIAFSDKLSNLRAIRRDFIKEGKTFWNRFNQKDPMMHKWYYSSFLDTCKELKDSESYKEYSWLIKNTF